MGETPSGQIYKKEVDGVIVFTISGYFEESLSRKLLKMVHETLAEKKVKIIFDVSQCSVITSFGVSIILESGERIVEDFQGTLVICQPSDLAFRAFTMAGVFHEAAVASSITEAISLCKS